MYGREEVRTTRTRDGMAITYSIWGEVDNTTRTGTAVSLNEKEPPKISAAGEPKRSVINCLRKYIYIYIKGPFGLLMNRSPSPAVRYSYKRSSPVSARCTGRTTLTPRTLYASATIVIIYYCSRIIPLFFL